MNRYIRHILIVIALLHITIAKGEELPDLGERSATYISAQQEKKIAQEFMKEIRLNLTISEDPIINFYIENLGNKLAANSNAKNRKYHFFVVNDPAINAFAGPAGYLGINTGTITAADSESELASVMAHEIAHISQHHIERLVHRVKTAQIASMGAALAGIIIGSATNSGDLATGAITASAGGAIQHMINFTREHEIEADNIGMKILYKSSFDPQAMPTFFEKLQRLHHTYTNSIPKFLRTHPVTSDRIAESKNRAEKFPPLKVKSPTIFYLVKARVEVENSTNIAKLAKDLNVELSKGTTKNKEVLQYEYALALAKNQQLGKAIDIANKLREQYPNEVLFQMLVAELAAKNKQYTTALGILKTSLTKNKTYYPLIIQYAQTLIAAKQLQEACDFLKSQTLDNPDDADLFFLLAKAYAENNQIADAYQARAKAYTINGYNHQAVIFLQQALETPKLSKYDRMIIEARIEELKRLEK